MQIERGRFYRLSSARYLNYAMVRGGPANRAVKRAKVFALAKVSEINVPYFDVVKQSGSPLGLPGSVQELLQPRHQTCTQSTAVSIHKQEVEEKGHATSMDNENQPGSAGAWHQILHFHNRHSAGQYQRLNDRNIMHLCTHADTQTQTHNVVILK